MSDEQTLRARRRPLLRILAQCPRRRLGIALAASLLGATGAVGMVAAVNQALQSGQHLQLLALAFTTCAIVAIGARIASGMLFAQLGEGALLDLRRLIARRIAAAEFRSVERLGAAKVQSVMTDDARRVSDFLMAFPNIVMNAAIVVGCLGYLAWFSLQAFLLSIVVTLMGSAIFLLGNARAIGNLKRAGQAQDELFGHFDGLFAGAKELKLNRARAEAFLALSLEQSVSETRVHRLRGLRIYVLSSSSALFLVYALIGVLTFWTGTAAAGSTIIFLYLMMPLEALLNNLPNAQQARLSMGRIDFVLEASTSSEPRASAAPAKGFSELVLKGVRHRYYRDSEEGTFELGPIDLVLRPGEIVMLIGGNGSGKTTLAKIITGLYPPEAGSISIDGREVGDGDRDRQRSLFSAVFSDFYLFPTLAGVAASSEQLDARANALIEKLQLSRKVTVREGVLSTRELSQGQRKRLALVVAYLEDRPFYLFDEWAADQDPAFREIFYNSLLPELRSRGKAVLAISHDDRYFDVADRCVKLENGAVVEVRRQRSLAAIPE
ncbi:putative ATP-binding cassette transporter [Arboricoccus pini]|uniref:Putative ATP-binding cassette transporter n=1 Tax=Arboricoccus pini TaxID=1963835 RepID=A0A212RLZ2_9PROT|nr:cyclic peptide export ABC transporter [Arboricoccus pini]SNB73369.1 putative ATP-binding cassette transporter [Arboricoccus pini]